MDTQKEFLEHIRLVHFTLVVTALALLVASSLKPTYVLESAYQEAVEIRRFAGPLIDWLRAHPPEDAWIQILRVNAKNPIHLTGEGKTYSLLRSVQWLYIENDSGDFLSGRVDLNTPTKLEDFVKVWNDMDRWSHLLSVTDWDFAGAKLQMLPGGAVQPVLSNRPSPLSEELDTIPNSMRASIKRDDETRHWYLTLAYGRASELEIPGPLLRVENVKIPLDANRVTRSFQKDASAAMHVNWREGKFADSFRELSQLSEGLSSLGLADLEDYLSRLRAERGASIELFGASVPTDALRTWGIFILVGVQLYFMLHLNRYRRISALEPWDDKYPWIGVYKDATSTLVFVATAVAMPIAATISVLARAPTPNRPIQVGLSWAGAALSLFVAAMTLLEIVAVCRLRGSDRGSKTRNSSET